MSVWPGAEEHRVGAGTDTAVVGRTGGRIPQPGLGHVLGAGLVLAPGQDLAGRQQSDVQRHDVPGHRRVPLARGRLGGQRARRRSSRRCAVAAPVVKRRVEAPVPVDPQVARTSRSRSPSSWRSACPGACPDQSPRLRSTTTPGTATPPASFTTTTGCEPGAHTSRSSALAGGCWLTRMVAAGPAAARSRCCPAGVGVVGVSPVQVVAAAATAAARRRRLARCKRVIGIGGRRFDS